MKYISSKADSDPSGRLGLTKNEDEILKEKNPTKQALCVYSSTTAFQI